MDIKDIPLGQALPYTELIGSTHAVWGGIGWPSKDAAGYACVLAAGKIRHAEGREMILMDEFESFDVRELVLQAVGFDLKYSISWPREDQAGAPRGRWVGDESHDAAQEFIKQAGKQFGPPDTFRDGRRSPNRWLFNLARTALLDMEHLYSFLLPTLKKWLMATPAMLYLKDASQVEIYLGQFESLDASDTAGLDVGYMPAVEALGFVSVEMQRMFLREEGAHVETDPADMGVQNYLKV